MLTIEEIRELSHRGKSRRQRLMDMKAHQDWVKFHCETSTDASSMPSAPLVRFSNMVKANINDDKYEVFLSLLRPPYPTTSVTGVIFDRLSRIFEGRNPKFDYQFGKTGSRDDWEWYRANVLNEPSVWKTKGWEYFKTEPNSVLVVDMPLNGRGKPEPYFYWVVVDDILDYGSDEEGNITWIMFRNREREKVYVIDDTYYRSFDYVDNRLSESYTEAKHTLGYCPAKFFVSEPVSLKNQDVKKSPITDILADLDWYLFYAISERHLDIYGSWPIYSGYQMECNYDTEIDGKHFHCHGGYLCDDDDKPLMDGDHKHKCPACSKHRTAGPGSYIEVPVPVDSTTPDMRNPVQILTVDNKSLEFVASKRIKTKNELIATAVGVEGDAISQFSISEKQIDAGFESQSTILVRVKNVFEKAQEWVDSTICRLRYGIDFEQCSIDYGSEFFTLTTNELRKRYQTAKESGASEADLAALYHQIVETEYRTKPVQLQRMLILSDVEPYLGLTRAEVVDQMKEGLLDMQDVKVKLNFSSLIQRFERENGSVIEFGAAIPYNEKINTIKNTLREYANYQS